VLDNDRLADILGTGTVDYAAVELVRASLEAGSSDNVTCVVADVVDVDAPMDAETMASTTTGPMLVGAAAEQPRKAGSTSKSFFRGHRSGDTGELEPVPGEARGASVDPEELRYAPRPPRRFAWLRRIAVLLVVLALLALAGAAAYSWTQKQYYVASAGKHVAIFRGIDADLPGMKLSGLHETSEITLASLPEYRAAQVRDGISAESLADARKTVERISELARPCPTPEPTPSASPSPTESPRSGDATGRPRASASPSPEPSPEPTESPSPTLAPPDCVEVSP
jgi:protein phosphatase